MGRREILAQLERLRRLDPQFKIFGANGHHYHLNDPLPASAIEAFEQHHKIRLPDDYRSFITTVGNGGAGPYYGVFRFGEHDENHDFCPWDTGYLLGDLAKPFVHTTAWNATEALWQERPDLESVLPTEDQDRLMEAWDRKLEEQYWNPQIMNGAIPICHLGCALRQWLVVHGPQKGFVWGDERVDEKGIHPLRDALGNPVTFAMWYGAWLRDPVAGMKEFKRR